MKRFGDFRPLDSVISSDNLLNLHIAVSSVEELSSRPNNTIAVFTQDSGTFHSGDIVINKGDGKGWVTLKSSLPRLGPVTNMRGYRMDKRVYIKWKDPSDIYDNSGNKKCSWHHDIVVRKYGSAPQNELDGTVVRVVYAKDKYGVPGSSYLIDYIPDADGDAKWYYRVFPVADNGTIDYANAAQAITLTEMPWSNIVEIIAAGKTSDVLNVGDSWLFGDGNEMVVADISKTAPYRVTMMLKFSRYDIPFDAAKGKYYLTMDKEVLKGKTYYIKNGENYETAGYIRGTTIENIQALDGHLYEMHSSESGRGTSGSNRWSVSDLRYWMNTIHLFGNATAIKIRPGLLKYLSEIHGVTESEISSMYSESLDGYRDSYQLDDLDTFGPVPPYFYLEKFMPEILDSIIATPNKTYLPPCDGRTMETTQDYFFLPSITEITGLSNKGNIEGKRFGVFAEGIEDGAFMSVYYDETKEDEYAYRNTSAFTRSANMSSEHNGFEVLQTTGNSDKLIAKDNRGVIIAFNIGKE